MIPSVLKKPGLLLLSIAAMLFVVIASTAPAHAATLQEDSEKFLRYRAVAGCLANHDLEDTSPTKVINGEWFPEGFLSGHNSKLSAALLTGGDDNGTQCKNADSFLVSSASKLGFSDAGAMWCSMQPNAGRDNDASTGNQFERCTQGSGDYDVSDDDGAKQAAQFTEGIKAYATGGAAFPFEPSGAMRYYIYYETFMKFCDASREKDYIESTDKTKADSSEYVVINEVVLDEAGEPQIVRALYKVGKEDGQNHEVQGVWSLPNGDSYKQTCGELAQKTWEFDESYGLYIKAHPEEAVTPGGSGGDGSNEPVCSAGALGWIICPAINFIATMTDGIYVVVENMLIIDPVTVSVDGALYDTWTKFRDIANILFVITFFFVIFSQATSVGLSSYGVKKLLPRIIAAAILVNISFFLCQIALELSNIIGVSIDKLFASMHSSNDVDINGISWETLIAGILGGGAIWGGAAVVLGAGGITAAMAMILPFLVTALFAVVTAIAVLIARQVLIVLLIALAPLAFVAFILPNTQKYFQMWQNTFTTLLVMFPLVAALFAGSQLAANIVLSSPTDEDGIGIFTYIAAICMLFIPLFGIPYIVKFSGGLLGRVAGIVNNPNKGPFDSLRKRAEGYRDFKHNRARTNALGVEGQTKNPFVYKARKNANRDYKYNLSKGIAEETEQEYIAKRALGGTPKVDTEGMTPAQAKQALDRDRVAREAAGRKFSQNMAGSSDVRYVAAVQASAKATVDKIDKESAQRREVLIRAQHDPRELITEAEKGYVRSLGGMVDGKPGVVDASAARAYQNILLSGGSKGVQTLAKAVNTAENQTDAQGNSYNLFDSSPEVKEIGSVLRSDINGAGLKPKDNALATWAFTPGTLQDRQTDKGTYANLNPVEFVGQSPTNITNAVNTNAITVNQAQDMLGSVTLAPNFGPDKRGIVEDWLRNQGITPNKPSQGGPSSASTGTGSGNAGDTSGNWTKYGDGGLRTPPPSEPRDNDGA